MKNHYKLTFFSILISFTTFAQTPALVKDIRTGTNNSNPLSLTDVNGTLFFRASDGTNGDELWKSNGTEPGTVEVKNIDPTSNGSASGEYTNVNGTLFFHANDGTNGKELWKSNGTDAGTMMVKNITAGSGDSDIEFIVDVNGTAVFQLNDEELWRSDGTDAGTYVLMAPGINTGVGFNVHTDYCVVNGILYFQGGDLTNGDELWRTDGTTGGTMLVKDITPGTNGSGSESFVDVNGTLFFSAKNASGFGLWKSNGTEAGTVLVTNLPDPFGFYGGAVQLTNVNGTLFYTCPDQFTNGFELWKSNGTSAGTVLVKDINPGTADSGPGLLTNVNGTLYFRADDGTNGPELWKSNGTEAGTVLVKDIGTITSGASITQMVNVNGNLFFLGLDPTTGYELFRSDGTAPGTVVLDIYSGFQSALPALLTAVGNDLYFSATDGTTGIELWSIQDVTVGLNEVAETNSLVVYPNPAADFITINSSAQNALLQLTDVTGKLIRSEKISSIAINVSQLSAGLYFGRITGSDNSSSVFKFVKE